MSSEERLTNVEEFSKLMLQWARRAEERFGEWQARMNELAEAQANSDAKIAALADAQIRTEEVMASLVEQSKHTGLRFEALIEQAKHTDQRLDALIDIVREMREGNPPAQQS